MAALDRCFRRDARDAIRALGDGHPPSAHAVHAARQRIKRMRATLRLLRGAIPLRSERSAASALREAAHALAPARDARVRLRTLDRVAPEAKRTPASTLGRLRARLADRCARREAALARAARQAMRHLRVAARRAEQWPRASAPRRRVRKGVLRSHARGREALARAAASPGLSSLHALRKQVQALRYQLEIADALGVPLRAEREVDLASALAQTLGQDRDLALLAAALGRSRARPPPRVASEIARRRARLRTRALRLGRALYGVSSAGSTRTASA